MHKTALFDLLRTFSKKEMKDFGDFVNSPYFNTNDKVIQLYSFIKKCYPDLYHASLEKEKIYGKIFPGEDYNDNRMRQLVFNLVNLAEEFVNHQFLKTKNVDHKKFLLTSLKNRGASRLFEKNLRELTLEVEKLPKDEDYYLHMHDIEYENLAYHLRNNSDANEKTINKTSIQKLNDDLIHSYIIRIVKSYIFLFNMKSRFSLDYKMSMLEEMTTHLEKNKYENVPLIPIYYNILMMHLKPEEESYFKKVKELVFKYEGILDRINITNIYINLENYCLRKVRAGVKKYQGEMLELYKKELTNKIYSLPDHTMSPIYFKNVIRFALMTNDIEWVENFIERYKHEINKSLRESAYRLGLALVEYHKKDYGKALENLSLSQNENLLHKLEIKLLMLQIYYDAKEFEPLELLVDSFRHFLNNNKLLSETRREMYSRFMKFVNALMKQNFNRDTAELGILKKQVINAPMLDNREWLIDKIEELMD